jgi:CheY-like chemotaxis protein
VFNNIVVLKSLLIFNDKHQTMRWLSDVLHDCDVDVTFAASYVEVLEKIEGTRFDGLVLDMVVPQIPGGFIYETGGKPNTSVSREAAAAFREANPSSPIILDSIYAGTDLADKYECYNCICMPRSAQHSPRDKANFILDSLGIDKFLGEELEIIELKRGKISQVRESNNDMLLPYDNDESSPRGRGR